MSHPAQECFGIVLKQLESVAEDGDVWNNLLSLVPLWPDPR